MCKKHCITLSHLLVTITLCKHAKLLQSSPTLWDPMDSSQPGSSVHGILQARILEWIAFSFSRRSSQPTDQTHISSVSCIGRQVLHHQCHSAVYICQFQFTPPPLSSPDVHTFVFHICVSISALQIV